MNQLYYQDKKKRRPQTQLAQATYSSFLNLVNDLIVDHEKYLAENRYTDKEQLNREIRNKKRVHATKVDRLLKAERTQQNGIRCTRKRYLTAADQTAAIEFILLSTKYEIFWEIGPLSPADMYLTGLFTQTQAHTSNFLRIVFSLPQQEP